MSFEALNFQWLIRDSISMSTCCNGFSAGQMSRTITEMAETLHKRWLLTLMSDTVMFERLSSIETAVTYERTLKDTIGVHRTNSRKQLPKDK